MWSLSSRGRARKGGRGDGGVGNEVRVAMLLSSDWHISELAWAIFGIFI